LREIGNAACLRVQERHAIDTEAAKLVQLFKESCHEHQ
jgi:hypothetical protein